MWAYCCQIFPFLLSRSQNVSHVKLSDLKNTTKACQLLKKKEEALLINHDLISVIQTHHTHPCIHRHVWCNARTHTHTHTHTHIRVCVYFSKFRNQIFFLLSMRKWKLALLSARPWCSHLSINNTQCSQNTDWVQWGWTQPGSRRICVLNMAEKKPFRTTKITAHPLLVLMWMIPAFSLSPR